MLLKEPHFNFELSECLHALWRDDSKWAHRLLEPIPSDLAASLFNQYLFRWEKYVKKNGQSRSANIWLRKQVALIKSAIDRFPVHIASIRNAVKRSKLASDLAKQCYSVLINGIEQGKDTKAVSDDIKSIAWQWNFSVSVPAQLIPRLEEEGDEEYEERIEETFLLGQIARLITEEWWVKKLDIAYKRFCEHCRIIAGKVRKGVAPYLSRVALREFRDQKIANKKALANMIAKNELTGEEIEMLKIQERSISNPKIRRHELMVRMRGFETAAEEQNLKGGFFTATAPSKYHSFTKTKNGKAVSNRKYEGASPKDTACYLSKIWARARAKLKRMDIPLFGFRVCEPHHDATPHWHMLFFFRPEDEQLINLILADYFTRENREELRVSDFDFDYWGMCFCKETKQLSTVTDHQQIKVTQKRIKARFKYEELDPAKGGATAYIAKYISKNIDGFKMDEDEETGEPANKMSERVMGWSSHWGIRQFQQIGGPSVSVWRELRRMEQDDRTKAAKALAKEKGERYQPPIRSFLELKADKNIIELARIAADSGNWNMYVSAMGGIFCQRNLQPIRLAYKSQENAYGESVKKLKGITNKINLTMLTRSDGWVITRKNSQSSPSGDSRAPWSSVNNCTEQQKRQVIDAIECVLAPQNVRSDKKYIDEDELRWIMQGKRVVVAPDMIIRLKPSLLDLNGQRRPPELIVINRN